jgi:ABC-type lipoprotein export system ATPase subunit
MSKSATQSTPVFELRSLSRTFRLEKHRIEVLKSVDLSIAEGSWTALVGRSGSGKTTLLQILGALDRPDEGTVACRGRDYWRLSGRRRDQIRQQEIGFVFQSYHLFPELNAHENVVLPALRWGTDRHQARQRAAELLERFELGGRLRHRPRELSGGEQQRVALARALINDPGIILADEPTGNLDVTAGGEITAILKSLHRDEGKTIVMVTHDLQLAQLADQVFVMHEGKASAHRSGTPLTLDK